MRALLAIPAAHAVPVSRTTSQHPIKSVTDLMAASNYRRFSSLLLGLEAIILAGGCVTTAYRSKIQDPYAYDRIVAIREAGERRDRMAVPLLVDRLEDEDPAVRFYSILALERITGDRLGYRYEESASERHEAVERWRKFASMPPHDAVEGSETSTSQPRAMAQPRVRVDDR